MQNGLTPLDKLKELYTKERERIHRELFEFLRFESLSALANYRPEMLSCCSWVESHLKGIGFDVVRWETSDHPCVFASHRKAGADAPTLLLYGHYDVQPVDPIDKWLSPPFEPCIRDGEIYARGAQDNKGQLIYCFSALRLMLERNSTLPINVICLIEGGEEIGSAGLAGILESKRQDLQADYVVVADLGFHEPGVPAISLGVRGIVYMTVTFRGACSDLHSGSHGGIVYNPNHALVKVLGALRDDKGKILVPEFYDDIVELPEPEKERISFDIDITQYEHLVGAKANGGEEGYSAAESAWIRPTLEINGIAGGYAGEGFKTVIPSESRAHISCRLVPGQKPERIAKLIKETIQKLTPDGIEAEVRVMPGSGEAIRTSSQSKGVKAFQRAFTEVDGKECKYHLEGASIPITKELARVSGGDVLLLGYALPGDNIHAPNEHFGVDRLEKGFLMMYRALELLAKS